MTVDSNQGHSSAHSERDVLLSGCRVQPVWVWAESQQHACLCVVSPDAVHGLQAQELMEEIEKDIERCPSSIAVAVAALSR